MGLLNAAIGVGGLIGVGVAFALIGRKRLAADFGIGLVLVGAGLAFIGVWPTLLGAMILLAIFGIGNTLVDVSGVTLMQRAVRTRCSGVSSARLQSILVLGLAVGALIAPPLIDLIGTRGALIVVGSLCRCSRSCFGAARDDRRARTHPGRAHRAVARESDLRAAAGSRPSSVSRRSSMPLTVAAGEAVIRQGDPATASTSSRTGAARSRSTARRSRRVAR